jgi:protein-tyrosine phosphatase
VNGKYIDLHLHLLPGVDDGPQTPEEALDLARALVEDGAEAVTVTPHFNAWNVELLSSKAEVEERVDRLRTLLAHAAIPLAIYPGAEHFLTPELVAQLRQKIAPTLAGGPYLLIELPFNTKPLFADEVIFELTVAGVTPVLAHPERYSWVQMDPSAVVPLLERGVILQLTAPSLLGHYGSRIRKTAQTLLACNAYGLVGSDLHHIDQPRHLSQLAHVISDIAGADAAVRLLQENPRRVLRGEPLVLGELLPFEAGRRGFWGLFRGHGGPRL